ncbi:MULTISPECIES: hypothetical protein [unclassified Arthrobacter]|uniref:hypothetical protein n=1 Tax=unclassified Arthrobacter TaxID=235627 RepID=UPI0011B07E85|nr:MULTISPECIES: hypothetical protein [unclassified Arthrobacter]
MTTYPYDMQLVVDPFNTSNVVANGQIYIYDPADSGNTSPLILTDPNGLTITNPLMSNSNGFLPPFIATLPQVKWVGAGFVGFFDSYHGLRNEAIDAKAAAQDAAIGSTTSAGAAVAAQAAAELAAQAAVGGGVAIDPTDEDALVFTTKSDGSIAVDPSDSDALLITA